VVGIVASRVSYSGFTGRRSSWGATEPRGGVSGRSIEGFDLAAALRECDGLLLRHGGHAMAAGLSIVPENLAQLRERLNSLARHALSPDQLRPPLRLDAVVGLSQLTEDQLVELDKLRPTGQGNPPVQLVVSGLNHDRTPQRVGRDRQHAKFWVTDGRVTREAIWYGAGDRAVPAQGFDLACVRAPARVQRTADVQLKVLDWRPGPSA
jgi:single-stranded-DNA-specific exonuclease